MLTSTDTAWLSTPATEAEPTCASMDSSRTGRTSPEGPRRPYADRGGGAGPCRHGTRWCQSMPGGGAAVRVHGGRAQLHRAISQAGARLT